MLNANTQTHICIATYNCWKIKVYGTHYGWQKVISIIKTLTHFSGNFCGRFPCACWKIHEKRMYMYYLLMYALSWFANFSNILSLLRGAYLSASLIFGDVAKISQYKSYNVRTAQQKPQIESGFLTANISQTSSSQCFWIQNKHISNARSGFQNVNIN